MTAARSYLGQLLQGVQFELQSTRIRLSGHMPGVARQSTIDRHSALVRKQLDWVVEAAHRIFADAFEIEIAFDEVGERAGQQYCSPQLFGEGFETRSHVDGGTDDCEVEPGA